MIKIKESQLIAMLNLVKENPEIDIWELMSVSGIRVLEEKSIYLDNPPIKELLDSHNTHQGFIRTVKKRVPPKGERFHPGQPEFYQ